MNSIQMSIMGIVIATFFIVIFFYYLNDRKFKKKVIDSFKNGHEDVLTKQNKPLAFDSIKNDLFSNTSSQSEESVENNSEENDIFGFAKQQPEIFSHKQPAGYHANEASIFESYPHDLLTGFFDKVDAIDFPYANKVDGNLDLIIDIYFEEAKKIKSIPQITQLCPKKFSFYALDSQNQWSIYDKSFKKDVQALKIVMELVDKHGLANLAQVENVYKEVNNYVLHNMAHVRASDYKLSLKTIQKDLYAVKNVKLDLELYLITKNPLSYVEYSKFFDVNDLEFKDGEYHYIIDGVIAFKIVNQEQSKLGANINSSLFKIVSFMHLQENPLTIFDKVFELGELFMNNFESRMLTATKQVIAQKEYNLLLSKVNTYIETHKKRNVQLGSKLLKRLFV